MEVVQTLHGREFDNGLFKVNLEMAIFGCDQKNEISDSVKNWKLKTWVSRSMFLTLTDISSVKSTP